MRALFLASALIAFAASAAQQSSPIDLPSGTHKLLLEAEGDGAQIYTCTDGKWVLKAPEAKLLDAQGTAIGTHFAGPTWSSTTAAK